MITNRTDRIMDHSTKKFPMDFFILVLILMIPFWLFGSEPLPIPVKLPVSAFAAFTPMIAAVILTYRKGRFSAVKGLFEKVFDYRKIKNRIWYLPSLFLYPLIALLSYAIMRVMNLPLPDPQIPWQMVPVFMVVFFIFGIGEELGWMGYALDPIQDRWGAVKASLFLGLIWGLIHVIPDIQNGQTATWILWQRLGTIATRVIMVWIYNNAGRSVFAMILFHISVNLGWALFPNFGSHYDPFITGVILLLTAVIILLMWEPNTLARFRYGRAGNQAPNDRQPHAAPKG